MTYSNFYTCPKCGTDFHSYSAGDKVDRYGKIDIYEFVCPYDGNNLQEIKEGTASPEIVADFYRIEEGD